MAGLSLQQHPLGCWIAFFPFESEYYAYKGITAMPVDVAKKMFTVDDYYRMAEVGILGPEDRVELIDGEIIQMSPIGDRHAVCVLRANHLFTDLLRGRALVNIQNPLRLSNYTEPEPDLVLLKPRTDFYAAKKIRPEDALLVVEVSDTTLRYDRKVKTPRYAAAGVPEVWIVNLDGDELLVYRNPSTDGYSTSLTLHRGDTLSPTAFPDVVFKADDLLGPMPG